MRPKWIIGIFIAGFLLYTGIFGSQGFSPFLSVTSNLPFHEEFNDLTLWSSSYPGGTAPKINPAGELELQAGPPSSTMDTRCEVATGFTEVQEYTVTAKIRGEWGSQPGDNYGSRIDIVYSTIGANFWDIGINQTHIWSSGATSSGWTNPTWKLAVTQDTLYHVYTFCVAVDSTSTPNINIFKDANLLGTAKGTSVRGTGGLILRAAQGSLIHFDYIYIDQGLVVPGQPTAETGNIDVYCIANNSPVPSINVAISGPQPQTALTDSTGHAVFSKIKTGQYQVSATYSGKSPTATVTVTKDQTVSTTLDFTATTVGKASLTVTASNQYGGSLAANVEVKFGSSTVKTGTTPCTWTDLDPGTYTLTVTYNGVTQTFSPTLSTTSPQTISATFQTQGGVGDIWDRIKAGIATILNNSNMQAFFDVIGSIVLAVSFIMFVLPEKKKHEAAAPAPRTIIL